MPRNSPIYSPPRRYYGGRGRNPGGGGYNDGYYRTKRETTKSLLIRNLPLDCRPDELRISFERFGPIRDIYLPRDYYSGKPRGFGFVEFRNADDAAEAQYYMDGQRFNGRELMVLFAKDNRKKPEEMRMMSSRRSPFGYRSHGSRQSRSRSRSLRSRSRSRLRHRHRSRSPSVERKQGRERSLSPRHRYGRSHNRGRGVDQDASSDRSSYSPSYDKCSPSLNRSRQCNVSKSGSVARSPSQSHSRPSLHSLSEEPTECNRPCDGGEEKANVLKSGFASRSPSKSPSRSSIHSLSQEHT